MNVGDGCGERAQGLVWLGCNRFPPWSLNVGGFRVMVEAVATMVVNSLTLR